MLKKIIKSVGRRRWEHDDPAIRVKAVSDLDAEDDEAQAILERLANDDPELDVRLAATAKLRRVEALPSLILVDDLARVAAQRFGELCAAEDVPAALPDAPPLLERVARHANQERVAMASLERVHEPEILAELSLHAALARVRQAAIERLLDETCLTRVERESRSRDKTVHRVARERLDRIRHLRQALARSCEHLAQLAESAEKLTTAAADPMYPRRVENLAAQWSATRATLENDAREAVPLGVQSDPVEALCTRFEAAIKRARERADSAAAPAPSEPQSAAEVLDAKATEPASDPAVFEKAIASLTALREDLRNAYPPDALARAGTILDEEQVAWLAASDHQPPPSTLSEQFHDVCHELKALVEANARFSTARDDLDQALRAPAPDLVEPGDMDAYQQLWRSQHDEHGRARRLEALLRRIRWPDGFAVPDLLEQAQRRCNALDDFERHAHDVHERLRERLHDTLDRMQESVDAGSLRSSTGLQGEGKQLLRSLPQGSARSLQRRFTALTRKVQELKDWETFATAPKREALCDEMEALAKAPEEPDVQAPRIKALREAWRALGPPVSARDRRLLGRFNEAAEKAFAPCRAYFEEQSDLRHWNLENRNKICDELEHFLRDNDWSHPDWRAVEQIMHAAQNEWRKFTPVDRVRGREVQERFRKIVDDLRERLKEEWDRNVKAKEDIIHEAEQARDAQPMHEAVETMKELQRRWQSVGTTPRRKDQKLWKAFREVCDQVFSARDQERQTRRDAIEGQAREAEAICEELEQLIDTHVLEQVGAERLQEISRRFHQLELPREASRRLSTRFDRAEKSYRNLIAEAARARERAALVHAISLEETLARHEARMLAGDSPDADSVRSEVGLESLPDAVDEALTRRLDTLLAAISANDAQTLSDALEDAYEARRRIVIRMEILAGMDSPESESSLRMEEQVSRLSRGMGSRINIEDSSEDLITQWCEAGPDVPERSAGLRQRFRHALDEVIRAEAA